MSGEENIDIFIHYTSPPLAGEIKERVYHKQSLFAN